METLLQPISLTSSDEYVKKWENTSYSIHDYSVFGFPSSPVGYVGDESQVMYLTGMDRKKRWWSDECGLCVWKGERGPVYAREEYGGDDYADGINLDRIRLVKDQLAVYNKVRPPP
jgi:hypothetical protein